MDWSTCPPWVPPGNAFRIVVSVAKYRLSNDYGEVDMADQEHVVWFDRTSVYTLSRFVEDMASKIMWGRSQQLLLWGVDKESDAEWKICTSEQFDQMIKARWEEKVMHVSCEVVDKEEGYSGVQAGCSSGHNYSSAVGASGVTNVGPSEGTGDTCSSPEETPFAVDWSTLTIIHEDAVDGEAMHVVNEDDIYEAFGFRAAEEAAQAEGVPVPTIPAAVLEEMKEAAMPVHDNEIDDEMFGWDRDNPDMAVGTMYPSINDFRMAVRQHAIVNEFELGTEKSDRKRFRGYCKSEGCPWIIRAKTQDGGSVRIQINSIDHTCASRSRVLGSMASQAWIAERAIPLLKDKPDRGPKAVKEELEKRYNIKIPYQTALYGRQRAANKLFGKFDDSFDWLFRFKAEVELRSPGSVVEIDTETVDGKIHFSKFFCAFKASIDGFLKGCRPYISIDSTALNGEWNGHLPAATSIDGHNWMFPIAFGLFDSETLENWSWFIEQLAKALGPIDKVAICTDACKGLTKAVKTMFPGCEQRECFRHLMDNMKKKYSGDTFAKYMWPAARAYTLEKHNKLMAKVIEAHPDVPTWLKEHHSLFWSRCWFSEDIKCDYINNNLAECWNSWIQTHKDLPVDGLADAIRERTLVLFEKRRKIAGKLTGKILPAIIHQLNAASKGLGQLKVTKGGPEQAEVTVIYNDEVVKRHVVYLDQHMCTCREWQVSGLPCRHALAVITAERQPDMEKYVDIAYSVQKLQAAYAGLIPNITDKSQWPEVEKGFKLLPPISKKRGPGRQRKKRILGCLETTGKRSRQVKCKNCGELGHRRTSYKCPLNGTKKRKRVKKTKAKPGRKKATATEADLSDEEPLPAGDEPPQRAAAGSRRAPRTRAAAAREAEIQDLFAEEMEVEVAAEVAAAIKAEEAAAAREAAEQAAIEAQAAALAAEQAAQEAAARMAAAQAARQAAEQAARQAAEQAEASQPSPKTPKTPRQRAVATQPVTPIRTPLTRRMLAMQAQPLEMVPEPPPRKKITPRKKQLATKVKKPSTRDGGSNLCNA